MSEADPSEKSTEVRDRGPGIPERFAGKEEKREADKRFASGRYKGQVKQAVVREHFREFCEEAAKIAVDMEQGLWVDPETGKVWSSGRFSRTRIGEVMGFPNARFAPPSFLLEPHFPKACEWERVKREANMRMSADNVKPLVAVAASGFLMELLDRVLNRPEEISNRELLTETRKYVQMLVDWDAGTNDKPHIQTTINLLIQNIKGLPQGSRAKVMRLVGNEVEHAQLALTAMAKSIEDTA